MVPACHYFLPGNNKTHDKQPIPFSLHELFLLCFQIPRALLCNILNSSFSISFFHCFSLSLSLSFTFWPKPQARASLCPFLLTWDRTSIVGRLWVSQAQVLMLPSPVSSKHSWKNCQMCPLGKRGWLGGWGLEGSKNENINITKKQKKKL